MSEERRFCGWTAGPLVCTLPPGHLGNHQTERVVPIPDEPDSPDFVPDATKELEARGFVRENRNAPASAGAVLTREEPTFDPRVFAHEHVEGDGVTPCKVEPLIYWVKWARREIAALRAEVENYRLSALAEIRAHAEESARADKAEAEVGRLAAACDVAALREAAAKDAIRTLEGAIRWVLGEGGDFSPPPNAPRYWWRAELRRRALEGK